MPRSLFRGRGGQARNEGYDAYLAGKSREENPKAPDSWEWHNWSRGWEAAADHVKRGLIEKPTNV